MSKIQQVILLFIIGISDAYMISHPNLLGKIGVRIYNYNMFKTFPVAALTVIGTLAVCSILGYFLQKQKAKKWAKYILIFLLMVSLAFFTDVFFKFSAGSYAHTGKVFKFGMHLFPLLMVFIFGDGLWAWIKNNRGN
jgi:uncharacterized membrane protein